MRNLFNFILNNIHWLILLLLVIISTFLIINNNDYQRSRYVGVENEIVGKIYSVSNNVNAYVGLRKSNHDLMEYAAIQEARIQSLENQLKEAYALRDTLQFPLVHPDTLPPYEFIHATIVNKELSKVNNFLTLNKGSNHGVEKDMGVLSSTGIVGIVINASPGYSIVIPILNPKSRPSCKVLGSNYSGPLVWDEQDMRYAALEDLPRHVEFQIGDTVVTSGYSAVFPEGIPVGIIEGQKKQKNDNFNSLKVRIFTDFWNLSHVLIIKNNHRKEQVNLEKTTMPNEN